MEKKTMKTIVTGIIVLIFLALAVVGYKKTCNAATFGFVTDRKGTYYLKDNGKKHKGFLKVNGKWYYFNKSTGYMFKGWEYDKNKYPIRYFSKTDGHMFTGWNTDSKGNKRYFSKTDGKLYKGWIKNAKGQYRYFSKKNGYLITGWVIDSQNRYRYFTKNEGLMLTGWYTTGNKTRYFDPKTGYIVRSCTRWIDGKYHKFDSSGIDISK